MPPSAARRVDGVSHCGSRLRGNVAAVHGVLGYSVDLNSDEARSRQRRPGLFLPPHRAQALAVLRQRHGHPMHAGNAIRDGPRMVLIVLKITRCGDIPHQEIAAVPQCRCDLLQHGCGLGFGRGRCRRLSQGRNAPSPGVSTRLSLRTEHSNSRSAAWCFAAEICSGDKIRSRRIGLLGKALAMTLIARTAPATPTSNTSMPCLSDSTSPD